MAGFTNTIKQAFLEATIQQGVDVYVGYFIILPTPIDPAGTEFSGLGYARVAHQDWDISTEGEVMYRVNVGAIEFPIAAGDWVGLLGVGIWDAAVGGNLLWSGPLNNDDLTPVSVTVASGDEARFIDGDLRIGFGTLI